MLMKNALTISKQICIAKRKWNKVAFSYESLALKEHLAGWYPVVKVLHCIESAQLRKQT